MRYLSATIHKIKDYLAGMIPINNLLLMNVHVVVGVVVNLDQGFAL